MNATSINARQGDVLWWIALVIVTASGLAMRLTTIDRGTPSLGFMLYFALIASLVIVFATPLAFLTAFAWERCSQQPSQKSWRECCLSPIRWIRRRVKRERRAQWMVTVIAALIAIAATSATGRLPRWHVWMSAALVCSLIAWRVFAETISALRADAAMRADAELQLETALSGQLPEREPQRVLLFASDDRRARSRLKAARSMYKRA